jgi:hypothetical protein
MQTKRIAIAKTQWFVTKKFKGYHDGRIPEHYLSRIFASLARARVGTLPWL